MFLRFAFSSWTERRTCSLAIAAAAILFAATPATAQVQCVVQLVDLPESLKRDEELIKEHVRTAVRLWTENIECKPCSIEVEFRVKAWRRGYGRSAVTASYDGQKVDGRTLAEPGFAHELRTGKDPNGSAPDIELGFDPEYLKTFWWDANVAKVRRGGVPGGKLDALSVIMHELGHAIAFNGWLDLVTGALTPEDNGHPRQFISTYDQWVRFDRKGFTFNGPKAIAAYGRPIPLGTKDARSGEGVYHHIGGEQGGNRRVLRSDMMNNYVFEFGVRYEITPLDWAILADCGLPVKKRGR